MSFSRLFLSIGKCFRALPLLLVSIAVVACAAQKELPELESGSIPVGRYAEERGVIDDRGRFREILCTVLETRGETVPDYRPCEEALTLAGVEAGATGAPVAMGNPQADFLLLMVPGLGWECFEAWLDYDKSGSEHLAQFGYEMRKITVDGLSSTENNARQIRDYIQNLPASDAARPLVLLGYSKGAPDILTALVDYPELQQRVSAVVSLAGSIAGSPLANEATQGQANLLIRVPGSECKKGDNGAVNSLKTAVRKQWLEDNPLPDSVKYYSVVTFPEPERVSWGLQKSYRILGGFDTRNDTQVLIYDQMIPGSTLLAYANADHWAMAVPVARSHEFVGNTFVNHNDYPREAFLEAIARYLEEALFR